MVAFGNFDELKKKGKLNKKECQSLTLKQIRQTQAYKGLTPFPGSSNESGTYKFGNKSTANKEVLCTYLNDPGVYHDAVRKAISDGKKMGKRARIRYDNSIQVNKDRIGKCVPKFREPFIVKGRKSCKDNKDPDTGKSFSHVGLTSVGEKCCFQRKQSEGIKKQRQEKGKNKDKAKDDIYKRRKELKRNK